MLSGLEKGFRHPVMVGAAPPGNGPVENTPIRKQVPADLPMRRIRWEPVPGHGPGLGGPV